MASPLVDVGQGSFLRFQGNTQIDTIRFETIDTSGPNYSSVDITHLQSTVAREYMSSDLYDPGEIRVSFQDNPDIRPTVGTNPTVTVIRGYPPNGTNTGTTTTATNAVAFDVCAAFITERGQTTGLDPNKMMGTATIKLTGPITHINQD